MWEHRTLTKLVLAWIVTLTLTALSSCPALAASSMSIHRVSRSRRAVNSVTVTENAALDETLFDLNLQDEAKPLSAYTFAVVNATGASSVIFAIDGNKLVLRGTDQQREQFDREKSPMIRVNIEATRTSDPNIGQKVLITVEITLQDVNDSPPEITNPVPLQATVKTNAPPGTVVYTVTAVDTDSNPRLEFSLESVSNQRFEIQAATGNTANIVTRGANPFLVSESPLSIQVSVEDKNADPIQKITKTVLVTVGTLPPQFYLSSYAAQIYEESAQQVLQIKGQSASLVIQVIQFQPENALTFAISDSRFEIISDPAQRNQISLRSKEAFDYETTQSESFTVTVTESNTNYQSAAQVTVDIIDENDSPPTFIGKSQYFEQVAEDASVGFSVFEVSATDADSGGNREIVFSIEGTSAFEMETVRPAAGTQVYVGKVKVKNPNELDYEKLEGNNVRAIEFSIIATDGNSVSPKSSSVLASVTVNNINDNDPTIDNSSLRINAPSSSKQNDVVSIIGASDLDGDNIEFYLGSSTTSDRAFFTIERQSGKLSWARDLPPDQDTFELDVLTVDDGSCCSPKSPRTSTTRIVIAVEDANNNKPQFEQCNDYNRAEVLEDAPQNEPVVTVNATDKDRGENKIVTYRLVGDSIPLKINPSSGLISVEKPEDIVRARGRDPYIQVTVIGENLASTVKLRGYCTFRVNIIDVNDHPPKFERTQYDVSVLLSSELPKTITRVQATDDDFGENANITYSLGNSAPNFFSIDALSGSIILQQNSNIRPQAYSLTIIANDNGIRGSPLTGTTIVNVNVEAGSFVLPRWISPPPQFILRVDVPEDTAVGTTLATLQCVSQSAENPRVAFIVFDTTKSINDVSEFFSETTVEPGPGSTTYSMQLRLKKGLNFLIQTEHLVTATCSGFNSGNLRAEDIVIRVNVQDTNNQPPLLEGMDGSSGRYQASVPENSRAGTFVRTVQVNDLDATPQFRVVNFELMDLDASLFTITKTSATEAKVETAAEFDREKETTYNFKIRATDGVNSDERYMVVTVTDINDQVPAFARTRYEFDVSETADINYQIGEVTATDLDQVDQDNLEYQFTSGNQNGVFTILSGTGQIRLVRKLDFEDLNELQTYTLQLTAYDNSRLHSNTTTVIINVLDENDNPPSFTESEYIVDTGVVEEDPNNNEANPKWLVNVTATDRDTKRNQTKITYTLTEPSNLFQVNAQTGSVYLIGKLDRDGPVPETRVTIRAADEPNDPLYAYADVVVTPTDINDNSPRFDTSFLSFDVDENSPKGTLVGTVLARDDDAGINKEIKYRMDPNSATPRANYFTLSITGNLETDVDADVLDYENFTSVQINVEAYDGGNPVRRTVQAITITLNDMNDQKPYFERSLYTTRMSEATRSGEILRVEAKDADSDPFNRRFKFEMNPPFSHFLVSANEDFAVIEVNPDRYIDYETDDREFQFTLTVSDGSTLPDHTASTSVVIIVEDYNDNVPVFGEQLIQKTIAEGDPKGAYIATFSATDKDSGVNAEIEYSIQQDSDPYFEFYVDPFNGNVTTRKVLDRELADTRTIIVLAIDKGETPLTGSATLSLTLTDINDNAPMFAEDYQPIVPENEDNNNRIVVEIFAVDPDTRQYGPPFGFALPDGCSVPACSKFTLQYNSAAANGNGSATIRTSSRFDREAQKKYFLPVLIWDMNGQNSPDSQTATSTLTIEIGDKNDNKHSPGHQEITFNNFDGKFGDVGIGRVYAEDADDWDLPDKTFIFVSPEIYKNYFSVDGESGIITIKKGVPVTKKDEPYEFKVDVFDKIFKNTETCTVAVHVVDLPDEALKKAGSVRLTGISAEEFIAPGGPSIPGVEPPPSKMHKFRAEIARILQYPGPDNIEVVGLTDGPNYLDVRFSGHASPYLTASQMESAVMLNTGSIQNAAGIRVGQVPINLCMEERFSVGCYNDVEASAQPLVIDANGRSLTTADLSAEAKDGCPSKDFPEPVVCSGDYCFNGGTCVQDDWHKLSCSCRKGFDGPRCQQRRHSFDGNSIAFYKGLSACTEGRTSIEFITLEADGLIMFSGPVIDIDPNNSPQDFMILELKDGYPQLRLNLGVDEVQLTLDGLNEQNDVKMPRLNDGQWHRIDIDKDSQDVTLTVDHCKYATADANGTVMDWSPCRTQGRVPGGDVLLNVQSLLQLGGRYPRDSPPSFPTGVPTKGFKGCLRNLFHNSILYDLYYKPVLNWNSGQNGCPREEGICEENNSVPSCGVRASCQSQWNGNGGQVQACTCHAGWYGDKCSTAAPVVDLGNNSFLQWELTANQIQEAERTASFQLMFRSREQTGTLFAITNAAQDKIDLELENGHLVLRYNLGQGERMLKLDNAAAADGAWHLARVERFGSELQLTVDAGEGRTYTYRPLVENVDVLFTALPFISVGGRVPTMASPSSNQISNDLVQTCIQDVRFNGHWLPMTPSQNSQAKLLSAPNVAEGCSRNDCYQVSCTDDRFCYPLWGAHECRCLAGSQPDATGKCISACEPNPCFNQVPCSIVNANVKCECPPDFTGQFCNIGLISEDDDSISAGAIVGIVVAIIVLLVLVILIVLFITCRKHDSEKNILEVDPDDDFIRENVMYYDEEGAGEEDHEAYDITLLQKMNSESGNMPHMIVPKESDMTRRNEPRLDRPDVGSFIDSRIRDTENDDDPFKDVPMEFNYEGGNSDAGSLSSLNTSSSGGSQDYDYLNDWGPKFARLADMYGAGQNLES